MQDRLTYANGNTITTEGFRCSVGEPIDIKVTVGEDEEVDLGNAAGKIIPNGDHLITLEVNGEKAAYRDLYHLGADTVTVGDYTISDDMYLYGVSEGDEVVMRFEPVELTVTDAFRAAVKSLGGAASDSSGGGSGGVLMVNGTWNDNVCTLDKTWQEIYDGGFCVVKFVDDTHRKVYGPIVAVVQGHNVYYVDVIYYGDTLIVIRFSTSSASDYPSATEE